MAVRKYKPTTPGRRGASVSSFEEITRAKPERSLVAKGRNRAGRNSQGRVTTRHQGGGNKRRYRVIDFRRDKDGVPAKVAHIGYDTTRTARISLLHYADGEKRYILSPNGLRVGDRLMSGEGSDVRPGNSRPRRNIPVGTAVQGVEVKPGGGARRGGRAASSGPHTRCRCGTSPSARRCTRWSSSRVAAPAWRARPARASRSWPRKARWPSHDCTRARPALYHR